MSIQSIQFRRGATKTDRQRDQAIATPAGVTECRNIAYGYHGMWNYLDIYYPQGTKAKLPTIISVHGGGYVYGDKETYRLYCMDLARRGFAVVNFSYRLAPKWKFPAQLEDTCTVVDWAIKHAPAYHLDPNRLFLVGDSAGANLACQFTAVATNPEYAALFGFPVPEVTIRGVGLNCGIYDNSALTGMERKGILKDFLGTQIPDDDPRLDILGHITGRFPPAFITTACHDFLRQAARPMQEFLTSKGVSAQWKCYGRKGSHLIGHVFHLDLNLPEATRCNDDQCSFFRSLT